MRMKTKIVKQGKIEVSVRRELKLEITLDGDTAEYLVEALEELLSPTDANEHITLRELLMVLNDGLRP